MISMTAPRKHKLGRRQSEHKSKERDRAVDVVEKLEEKEVTLTVMRPREPWAGLEPADGAGTLTCCCPRWPMYIYFFRVGGCGSVADNGGLEVAFV